LEDAVKFYTELIKLSPRDAQSYLERGHVHYSLTQFDKALADYDKAVSLDQNNPHCHHAQARLLIFCLEVNYRDLNRGLLHAKRAVELLPGEIAYRRTLGQAYQDLGFTNEAVAVLEGSVEVAPDSAIAYFHLAKALSMAGKPDLALVQALKAVELDPNNSTILHDLAKIYVQLGQDEKALEAVNKALEFHPKPMNSGLFYLHHTRAGLYARKEMFATALADYDKSLELAPYRSFTYKLRAEMYFELKDFDSVLVDLNRSLELNPGDLSAVWWISADQVMSCPSPEFRDGMRRLADRAVELNDRCAEALYARAQLLQQLGDLPQVRRDLEESLASLEKMVAEHPSGG
jgi:tetratricopeptide (TPR) repeat protein